MITERQFSQLVRYVKFQTWAPSSPTQTQRRYRRLRQKTWSFVVEVVTTGIVSTGDNAFNIEQM